LTAQPGLIREAAISFIIPTVQGTLGDDRIAGTTGSDFIAGNAGNDVISGNAGDDTLLGNQGNDWLLGGLGNDMLNGGIGNDVLYGGRGADTIYGDQGSDILSGDFGADSLYGGTGGDTFYFEARTAGVEGDGSFASDTIQDFGASDTLLFDNYAAQAKLVFTQSGVDTTVAMDIDGNGTADYTIVTVLNALKANVLAASSFGDLLI
jgi:Ca2+-binding RTX toxin-like protein